MTQQGISKAVLVTGCSTGIGRATARRLARRGWRVYATARRPESVEDLRADGCETLALDVCDEDSMVAAVRAVEAAEGAVGVLVNNAGYSQSGAVESVPLDVVRRQFETNVFGLTRLCQLALPGMRAQGWGKIVNLSSIGGKLTFPGGGFYHATKHAVEAISDCLRYEVRDLGVDVIVIEPGLIRTEFGTTASASVHDGGLAGDATYGAFNANVAKATQAAYQSRLYAPVSGGPGAVARTIERALRARRPRTRYTVTPSARIMLGAHALLPDRLWDAVTAGTYPSPAKLARR